jgi:molybdopterin synthase catalytic subunit
MKIEVSLTREEIPRPFPQPFLDAASCGTGALAEFTGIVRDLEDGEAIQGLRYELYEAMALREMKRLLEELALQYPCQAAVVCHRYGFIPAGEAAITIAILSKHRKEAFALLSAFMDRLKSEVPIWKVEAVTP